MKVPILLIINILICIYFTTGNKTLPTDSNKVKYAMTSNAIYKEDTTYENISKASSIGDSTLHAIVSYCKPYCNSSQDKISKESMKDKTKSGTIQELDKLKKVFNRSESTFGSNDSRSRLPIISHSLHNQILRPFSGYESSEYPCSECNQQKNTDYEGRLTDSFFKYVLRDKDYDRNEVPWIGKRGSKPVKVQISAFLRYVFQILM